MAENVNNGDQRHVEQGQNPDPNLLLRHVPDEVLEFVYQAPAVIANLTPGLEPFYPTGTKYTHQYAAADVRSDQGGHYPSTYWDRMGATKPKVFVNNVDMDAAWSMFLDMRNAHEWTELTVATFMVRFLEDNRALYSSPCPEGWTSNGQVICPIREGVTVSPINILHPVVSPRAANPGNGPRQPRDRARELSYFIAILCLYRKALAAEVNPEYADRIRIRLERFFASDPMRAAEGEFTDLADYANVREVFASIRVVMCAVDMFFFKYPTHAFAGFRIATLVTRYRGCVALVTVGSICEAMGIPINRIVAYIWTDALMEDFARIYKHGESIGDVNGYFPYHLEFGLVSKTQYSMAINPTLCYWMHLIGCILLKERHMRARKPEPKDTVNTQLTAVKIALCVADMSGLDYQGAITLAGHRALMERRHDEAAARAAAQQELNEENQGQQGEDQAGGDEDGQQDEHEEEEVEHVAQMPMAAVAPGIQVIPPPLHELQDDSFMIRANRILTELRAAQGVTERERMALEQRAQAMANLPERTMGHHFYQLHAQRAPQIRRN